jgi:transposase
MPRRPFTRQQAYLLPPSLDEWLPADHPVRYVAMFVASLPPQTWQELGVDPDGDPRGAPAYDPELLLSVWLAGFMTGIRSSRGLEAACRDQISFRWLSGNQLPDHNTLWRFYAGHRAGMQALLRQTVRTAVVAGLVDLALVAVDGTVVGATARRSRTLDEDGLRGLLERVEAAIADLEARHERDEQEDPVRLPQELARAAQLRERVEQALALAQAKDGPRQVNVTDPDATLRKGRHGWQVGYMAQAASTPLVPPSTPPEADLPDPPEAAQPERPDPPGGQLLVAVTVVASNDLAMHLLPLVDAAVAAVGWEPGAVLADSAFHSSAVLTDCQVRGQCVVIPESQPPTPAQPYHKDVFRYDPVADSYTCPEGQLLTFRGAARRSDGVMVRRYRVQPCVCRACPAFGVCTRNQRHGRIVEVSEHETALGAQRVWMATEQAQALGKRRKAIVEPPFGVLKERQALRRFLLRGLPLVRAEWTMAATAYNLRVLARQWQAGRIDQPGAGVGVPRETAPADARARVRRGLRARQRRHRSASRRSCLRRTPEPPATDFRDTLQDRPLQGDGSADRVSSPRGTDDQKHLRRDHDDYERQCRSIPETHRLRRSDRADDRDAAGTAPATPAGRAVRESGHSRTAGDHAGDGAAVREDRGRAARRVLL